MHYTAPYNGSHNGSHNGAAQPWLQDTVRNFFEQLLWDGRPPVQVSSPEAQDGAPRSPMTMAVKDFFATVPWDGKPVIAAPLSPLEFQAEAPPTPDSSAATLDDFFDSF